MKLTRLDKLFVSEVSGVDDPANELPGFMVAKAKAPAIKHPTSGRYQAAQAQPHGVLEGVPHNDTRHVRIVYGD